MSKMMFLVQIQPNFDLNRTIFDMNRTIFNINGPYSNQNRRDDRSDGWNRIEKLIKSWFESDLDRILAGSRSNRISLVLIEFEFVNLLLLLWKRCEWLCLEVSRCTRNLEQGSNPELRMSSTREFASTFCWVLQFDVQ